MALNTITTRSEHSTHEMWNLLQERSVARPRN